nr:MAG TPA: hypothetical protein [Caudoviricetes sp.]
MKFIKKLIAKHNAKREEEIQEIMKDWGLW